MKSKNIIKFAPDAGNGQQLAPWNQTAHSGFEDLIFTEDLKKNRLKLEPGSNWFRIVPALPGSDQWMLHVPTITMKHGRFAHPRTFQNGARSVFDHAYQWFAANAAKKLYNRSNPKGHRLLCDSLCAFWCLQENKEGKVKAKLFVGAANDGSRGELPGLGFRVWKAVTETDPDVDVVLQPVHPEHGALICVEKTRVPGARYPTYQVRVGRQAAPIQGWLDRMETSEFDVLRPIEKTIRELDDDEQWDHLARVIGADVAAEIRSSVA